MQSMILALTLNLTSALPGQFELSPHICCCPGPVVLIPPMCPPTAPALKPANNGRLPGDMVLYWNETTLDAIRADHTPPPLAARNLAMVHGAIYDSVNAIMRTHAIYYVRVHIAAETS